MSLIIFGSIPSSPPPSLQPWFQAFIIYHLGYCLNSLNWISWLHPCNFIFPSLDSICTPSLTLLYQNMPSFWFNYLKWLVVFGITPWHLLIASFDLFYIAFPNTIIQLPYPLCHLSLCHLPCYFEREKGPSSPFCVSSTALGSFTDLILS